MEQSTTVSRDAEILRLYKAGNTPRSLAARFCVSSIYVLKLIHDAHLAIEQSKANAYAQAVMHAGNVVYALPARHLKTSAGADAIIDALEAATRKVSRNSNVVVCIAVVPIEEIEGAAPPEAFDQPARIATSLQARAVNAARKNAEVMA